MPGPARPLCWTTGVGLDRGRRPRRAAPARRATCRPLCSSRTRCGCAGAARRSRSRASSRSRPAAARRTATSARSRACSPRRCAPSGSTSRRWSRRPSRPPRPGRPSSASSPPCAAPTTGSWRRCARASRRSGRRSTSTSPRRSACSPRSRSTSWSTMGVHRYNHNLETAAVLLPERGHHPHLGGALGHAADGPRLRHGGLLRRHPRPRRDRRAAGRVRRAAGRARPARGAAQLPQPAPGHAAGRPAGASTPKDALRAIAAFRLALPRTILRYAGGREITLGDLGTRDGLLGGINAVIVGNYLTTLGRPADRGPGPARRAEDAGQGPLGDAVTAVPTTVAVVRPVRRGAPATAPHAAARRPASWSRRGSARSAGAG